MSAAGVGAVLGALQFAARTSYKGLSKWIASMSVICSVGLIVFSRSHIFWISTVVLFVVGFAATSQMAATNTTVQNRVPDELRGRVMAVYATMFMGVQPIGALLAAALVKRVGAPETMTIFGCCCLAASIAFAAWVLVRVRPAEKAEARAGS
jgi:MFS family permease